MSNCGTCKHWNLKGSPLRAAGFGTCKADLNEVLRAGRTFSSDNLCRLGKFARADDAVVVRRDRELAP